MKTNKQIRDRILSIEQERAKYIKMQENYTFSKREKIEGSTYYGGLQERESKCNRRIKELEWVLE